MATFENLAVVSCRGSWDVTARPTWTEFGIGTVWATSIRVHRCPSVE